MEVEESPDLQPWLAALSDYESRLETLIHSQVPREDSEELKAKSDAALLEVRAGQVSRQVIKDLISPLVETWTGGLSALCQEVLATYPELSVSVEELRGIVHELASRIPYGPRNKRKDVYEDEDPLGYWTWQLDAYPPALPILKERKLIGKTIQSLHTLILCIRRKVTLTQKPNLVKIINQYDDYNKNAKKLNLFRQEREEKKRKREEIEHEKTIKKQKLEQEKEEKKAKLAEERLLKLQIAEAEKLAKAEAEKKAKLEVQQAKKAAKDTVTSSPDKQQRTLAGYFSLEKKPAPQRGPHKWLFGPELTLSLPAPFKYPSDAQIPPFQAGFQGWKPYFQSEIRLLPLHKSSKLIYHSDSAIKPYYTSSSPPLTTTPIRRNPFRRYDEVDYDKDSDEEFEEMVRGL